MTRSKSPVQSYRVRLEYQCRCGVILVAEIEMPLGQEIFESIEGRADRRLEYLRKDHKMECHG